MVLDLLTILAEDEEIAKAYGSAENAEGLLVVLTNILVQSMGKCKEKKIVGEVVDDVRMKSLSLLNSISYDNINKEKMGMEELQLMTALAGVMKQEEDMPARVEACAVMSSLASFSTNTEKMVNSEVLQVLVDVLSADKGEAANLSLDCLIKFI